MWCGCVFDKTELPPKLPVGSAGFEPATSRVQDEVTTSYATVTSEQIGYGNFSTLPD